MATKDEEVQVKLVVEVDPRDTFCFYRQARFLAHLSDNGRKDRFAGFGMAAREFPVQPTIRVLDEQHSTCIIENDCRRAEALRRMACISIH